MVSVAETHISRDTTRIRNPKVERVVKGIADMLDNKELTVQEYECYLNVLVREQKVPEERYVDMAKEMHRILRSQRKARFSMGLKDSYFHCKALSQQAQADIKEYDILETQIISMTIGMSSDKLKDIVLQEIRDVPRERRNAVYCSLLKKVG